MNLTLRDYQRRAIDSIYGYFASNSGNPLILAPTGSGKSVIIGGFCYEVMQRWQGQRILMLTHVKELVAQNLQRLLTIWPGALAGVYSAGLNRRDTWHPIIFASIQSVYRRALQLGRFDLILVDECHLIPSTGEGMYNRFLADAREINPALRVIGFTATPWRMKSGHLIGAESLFTDIAYDECDIRFLVERGYLCPVVPRETDERIDMTGVRVRGGEYVAKDLQAAADRAEVVEAAVDEIIALGERRRSWLIFCAGVDHARHVRDVLRERGITAETVTGDTPKLEREQIIYRYQSGQVRALTNCDVLTTGFDAPATDLLALLRPTKSKGLLVQMVGRGMRTAPGKDDCLVLDFAGNIAEHGPIDQIRVGRKRSSEEPGEAPTKTCPECRTIVSIQASQCEQCGHEFPPPEVKPKHDSQADSRELLSWQAEAHTEEIDRITFARHEKPGKPPSVRVTYWHGIAQIANEWICLEHGGYPRLRAVQWWQTWIGGRVPERVDDALGELGQVLRVEGAIAIKKAGRWPEVVGYEPRGIAA